MNKEIYEPTVLIVTAFEEEDVITTSDYDDPLPTEEYQGSSII